MSQLYRYHGRDFTDDEIDIIRGLCADEAYPTRAAIARAVCDTLGWHRIDGRRKDMAARVALLRMADDGLIVLPPARHVTANGRIPRHLLGATVSDAVGAWFRHGPCRHGT